MPEFNSKDEHFSEVLNLFLAAMVAREDGEEIAPHATKFNREMDHFFEIYPDSSLAQFAHGMTAFGIPYDTAFADMVWLRGQ